MRHPDSPFPPCDLADRPQGSNSPSCPTCRGDLRLCPEYQGWTNKSAAARHADGCGWYERRSCTCALGDAD